ncbi:MAG: hypothetical protein WKF59_14675 [Chitinophagaceae bacterium]
MSFFYTISVVPKIEGYSQRPAINFYKSLAGKDVYVTLMDLKVMPNIFILKKGCGKNGRRGRAKLFIKRRN